MVDDAQGPTGPDPVRPPSPSTWIPTVATPQAPAPRRKHRSGCGSSLAILVGILVVMGALVAGAVVAYQNHRENDPEYQREQRAEDLRAVCRGNGIDDVAAYRRGAGGAIGARFAPKDELQEARGRQEAVAFPLVPTGSADPVELVDARVVGCTATSAVEQQDCSFVRTTGLTGLGGSTDLPGTGGGTRITAGWSTRVRTELRIVEVRSGKVLHTAAFETPNPCPRTLAVEDDGGYEMGLPDEEIAQQVEGQMALYHQG